jgi:two-component system sensor histidine kinase KdpD
VYVSKTADLRHLTDEERDKLQRHLSFARALQIETRVLDGEDLAETLVTFARAQKVTQIFIVRQPERTLRTWFAEGFVQQIVNLAQDMQVTVVADRSTRRSTT